MQVPKGRSPVSDRFLMNSGHEQNREPLNGTVKRDICFLGHSFSFCIEASQTVIYFLVKTLDDINPL